MTIQEAIAARHSVRSYKNIPLSAEVKAALEAEIEACNRESGLHIQLVTDEPAAFDCFMSHYGKFSGVTNYLALIGKKGDKLSETCGYYGEQLVLKAQTMGLNTCWVATSYKKVKTAFRLDPGEKLCIVIALGYGETQGVAHTSRALEAVTQTEGTVPDWFRAGAEAALLAPTAMNQQKFTFSLKDGVVTAKAGIGICSNIDLGIVKYHFELGAGKEHFDGRPL